MRLTDLLPSACSGPSEFQALKQGASLSGWCPAKQLVEAEAPRLKKGCSSMQNAANPGWPEPACRKAASLLTLRSSAVGTALGPTAVTPLELVRIFNSGHWGEENLPSA